MRIAQLHWILLRLLERLGWLGNIAILMLLAALSTYFVMISPVEKALAEAIQLASAAPKIADKQVTVADNLNTFLSALPPVSSRAASIKAVMEIAASENLLLDEVTYKVDNKVNDAISHTHIEFTIVANYSEIQHFLSTLLHHLNYVSIDSLIFSREAIQDKVVEAQIRLILHFNTLETANAS